MNVAFGNARHQQVVLVHHDDDREALRKTQRLAWNRSNSSLLARFSIFFAVGDVEEIERGVVQQTELAPRIASAPPKLDVYFFVDVSFEVNAELTCLPSKP